MDRTGGGLYALRRFGFQAASAFAGESGWRQIQIATFCIARKLLPLALARLPDRTVHLPVSQGPHMNKLSLSLDALRVESFDTTPAERKEKGTVFGEQQPCTCPTVCSCPGCPSCDYTCAQTCLNTCAAVHTCDTCMQTCANWETTCTGTQPCYE